MHTLQVQFRVFVHGFITVAVGIVAVCPIIIVRVAIVDTVVNSSILLIFIGQTHCQVVADSMSETYTELPGRVDFEVVVRHVAIKHVALISVVIWTCCRIPRQIVGVAHRQVVEYRGVDIHTDTERRVLNGAEDSTELYIEASTVDLQHLIVVAECSRGIILCIDLVAAIVDIVQSKRGTQEYPVVDVATDIEVVLADIPFLILAEQE